MKIQKLQKQYYYERGVARFKEFNFNLIVGATPAIVKGFEEFGKIKSLNLTVLKLSLKNNLLKHLFKGELLQPLFSGEVTVLSFRLTVDNFSNFLIYKKMLGGAGISVLGGLLAEKGGLTFLSPGMMVSLKYKFQQQLLLLNQAYFAVGLTLLGTTRSTGLCLIRIFTLYFLAKKA